MLEAVHSPTCSNLVRDSLTLVEGRPTTSNAALVLSSDSVQADYEVLRSRGVEFEGPPERRPWATEAMLHDPDGTSFVLQQV